MNKEEPMGEVNHLISEVKMQITNSNTGPQRFNRGMVEGEKKREVKKPKDTGWGGGGRNEGRGAVYLQLRTWAGPGKGL